MIGHRSNYENAASFFELAGNIATRFIPGSAPRRGKATGVTPRVQEPLSGALRAPSLSKYELKALEKGDRAAYWSSRAARGDPIGDMALAIVKDEWGLGAIANNRLEQRILWREEFSGRPISDVAVMQEMEMIGVQLMEQHSALIQKNDGLLRAIDIAHYHRTVFKAHGLPPDTFGGTPLGHESDARWTKYIWMDQP